MKIRDRIRELRRVRAGDLLANPRNWICHRPPSLANGNASRDFTQFLKSMAQTRLTAGFEYVGPADRDNAIKLGVIKSQIQTDPVALSVVLESQNCEEIQGPSTTARMPTGRRKRTKPE